MAVSYRRVRDGRVTLLASPNYGLNRPQMALAAVSLSLADADAT